MFDQLFERPAAVRRHLDSLLVEERLEYLRYRAWQGYKRRTLRELAQDLLRIQNLLRLSASSDSFDAAAVEAAVKRCVPRRKPHSSCKNWRQKEVFYHAIHWLRFLKRLRLRSVAPPIYQPLKKNFVDYLRVEKGLSAETLRTRCGHVEDFLQWFFRNHKSLRQLMIADLDEAIARKGRDDGYARPTIQRYASDLRGATPAVEIRRDTQFSIARIRLQAVQSIEFTGGSDSARADRAKEPGLMAFLRGAQRVGRTGERGCDYVASVDREPTSPLAFKRRRHITTAAT